LGKKEEGSGSRSAGSSSSNLQSLLQEHQTFPTSRRTDDKDQFLHSITRVRALIETDTSFYIVQPYLEYSLRDILSYSPAIFDLCYSKPLFIIYQVLQALRTMHARGLPAGRLSQDTVLLDSDLWVSVLCPRKRALMYMAALQKATALCSSSIQQTGIATSPQQAENLSQPTTITDPSKQAVVKQSPLNVPSVALSQGVVQFTTTSLTSSFPSPQDHTISAQLQMVPAHTADYASVNEQLYEEGCRFLKDRGYESLSQCSVAEVVQAWVERRLSNFQYLLVLNHLAGRQMNDPNNHPVLPWVMDFSHPHDGLVALQFAKKIFAATLYFLCAWKISM
jgi:WD repeat-containing protein 81